MEKRGKKNSKRIFFVLLFSLIFFMSFASAANQTADVSAKAYACLESKVTDKCSSLSIEEKIFSLLSIERCKSEVVSGSLASECWPAAGCKIKTTAQAILALRHVNTDTVKAEKWLLSQTSSSSDLDWFLQVESRNKTSCTATYSGSSYPFTVNEDKTISTSAGNCLKTYGGYWFKVSPTCYNEEFKISCKNSFLTSLLYKKKASSTVYVSQKTSSASGEGTTTEKVSSSCFKDGSSCSYEGTLWAAVVLKYRGYDVSSYIPYLASIADENSKYIPESFLYSLTNDFKIDLLSQQQESKWWAASGDKFYDTAVALLPFQNEQITEKSNSIGWLEEVQGTDGCWQGNLRNTAFLVYSLWPKKTAEVSTAKDCEDSGYNCMSSASCLDASGDVMTDYTGCFGTNICCSKTPQLKTCSQQSGEFCDSDEECLSGTEVSSSDTTSGKFCCVSGTCGTQETQPSECESAGGFCKSLCSDEEEFSSYTCSSGNCCVIKTSSKGSSLWIIILLIILIVLVLLGIIFRKKLREFLLRLKSGRGKGKSRPMMMIGGPRFPPTSSQRVYPGAVQRRIVTPTARKTPARRTTTTAKKSDIDEVLKKLKEIGK
jgi:hypothetical protein